MANTDALERLRKQLAKKDIDPVSDPRRARQWLRTKVDQLRKGRNEFASNANRQRQGPEIGKLFFYYYNPKTKDKLPFWDKFPLTFPIEPYSDGFLGINLHYLAPKLRATLMDKLMDLRNNTQMNDSTKLRISYQLLNSTKKYSLFQPCLKRYLFSHMRSKFLLIEANEWNIAAELPWQSFTIRNPGAVYAHSKATLK